MGNCMSASGIIAPKIRVVQVAEGRVVDVELPPLQSSMKVGELMLEFSLGHFVTQLNIVKPAFSASTGMRATPLGADADAEPGFAYVLFPMSRLHTRVTPQEVLSFSKLIQLQDRDQQLAKPAHNPSRIHVHGLLTAGARVAPLIEEECKDVNLCSGADAKEQAYSLPITPQMSYEGDSSFMLSSCPQGHVGVIKAKPWTPALQTIMESS